MTGILFGPPPSTLEILLDDPDEHDFSAPLRMLRGLTPDQAVTVPPGVPYSIAQIVAHMHANVRFNLELIRAIDPTRYASSLENWPAVSAKETGQACWTPSSWTSGPYGRSRAKGRI